MAILHPIIWFEIKRKDIRNYIFKIIIIKKYNNNTTKKEVTEAISIILISYVREKDVYEKLLVIFTKNFVH